MKSFKQFQAESHSSLSDAQLFMKILVKKGGWTPIRFMGIHQTRKGLKDPVETTYDDQFATHIRHDASGKIFDIRSKRAIARMTT